MVLYSRGCANTALNCASPASVRVCVLEPAASASNLQHSSPMLSAQSLLMRWYGCRKNRGQCNKCVWLKSKRRENSSMEWCPMLLLDAGLYTNTRPGSCRVCMPGCNCCLMFCLLPHRFLLIGWLLDCRHIAAAKRG